MKKHLVNATILGVAFILVALVAIDFLAERFPQSYGAVQSLVTAYGLPGVFAVVAIGSSLLPFPTDLVYAVAIKLSAANPWPIIAVSVLAAFLASLFNYWLASVFREKLVKNFVSKNDLKEAKDLCDKYGPIPLVLFGVIPASPVFDPLTFVAGLAKMDFKKFALYSLVSRILHFAGLAFIALQLKLL